MIPHLYMKIQNMNILIPKQYPTQTCDKVQCQRLYKDIYWNETMEFHMKSNSNCV